MARKKNEIATTGAKALAIPNDSSMLTLPIGSIAAAKLPGVGGQIRQDGAVTVVEGRGYAACSIVIPDATVYFDAEKRPNAEGGWRGEADKVAWRDVETGLECIIMRDGVGGFLGGYVGVGRDHPLWGFQSEAIPNDLGIDVHGGVTYARICDEAPSPRRRVLREARTICHVVLTRIEAEVTHATGHEVEPHQWWFGFTCDHLYDLVPNASGDRRRLSMRAETGATYRDDGYVLGEVLHRARQLKAIASGEPVPARTGPPPPPAALDPWSRP